ncbi:MAG: transketolase C-terminal domain-containing protein, partial [Acidobacteriota bacterium]
RYNCWRNYCCNEAWRLALKQTETPTALVLTRQALPIIERESFADTVERGGYVLADAEDPRLILIATGSEVQIAVAVREQLAAEGISARVVSMPCCEVFDAQDHSYKESVLPAGVPRLAVEAASPDYWRKYIGIDGEIVGLDHFGASAPAKVLFEKFGITTDAVVEAAKKVLLKRAEEPGLTSNYSELI